MINRLKYNILTVLVIEKWSILTNKSYKSIERIKVISRSLNNNKPINRKINITQWIQSTSVLKALTTLKKKRINIKTN